MFAPCLKGVWPAEEPRAGPAEEGDPAQRVQDQEPGDGEEDQGDGPEAETGGSGQPEAEPEKDLQPGSEQGEVQYQVSEAQVDEHREENHQGESCGTNHDM